MGGVALYISTSGTVHLSRPTEDGRVLELVCIGKTVRMGGNRHPRWAGFPSREDIEEQRTVDQLAGKGNKKMYNRPPRLVCINCFPVDPMIVGVV